jgi:membrane-associated phospholipid phosphatase
VALAAALVVAGAAVYLLASHTGAGRWADVQARDGFLDLAGSRSEGVAERLVHLFDPAPFGAMTALLALVALARLPLRAALAVPAAMVAANVTTQVLKIVLDPAHVDPAAAWPSGHTTAVASVALAALVVAPARLRPIVAAVGGLLVAATVDAILLIGWHVPSDVLGGLCVVGAWFALAVALESPGRLRPRPAVVARALRAPAAVIGLAAALACAVVLGAVLARPDEAAELARARTTFLVTGAVLGAAALALGAAFAVLLRWPEDRAAAEVPSAVQPSVIRRRAGCAVQDETPVDGAAPTT